MNRKAAITTIRTAFASLPEKKRERLRFHADNKKIRVLCGKEATLFLAPGGA